MVDEAKLTRNDLHTRPIRGDLLRQNRCYASLEKTGIRSDGDSRSNSQADLEKLFVEFIQSRYDTVLFYWNKERSFFQCVVGSSEFIRPTFASRAST
jgi:hypothetical protein